MIYDPIIERVPLSEPFLWLQESAWEHLSDYMNDDEYTCYDDMYRLIVGEISWDDYLSYHHHETDIEEVKRKYQENFPKLMADAMIAMAQDIKKGNLVVKFSDI